MGWRPVAGQDKLAISRCNEGTSGQLYELPPKRKQPLGESPSLMAWVRTGLAVNSAGTNLATVEPGPSRESNLSVPVLSAESTSVESAAELLFQKKFNLTSVRR